MASANDDQLTLIEAIKYVFIDVDLYKDVFCLRRVLFVTVGGNTIAYVITQSTQMGEGAYPEVTLKQLFVDGSLTNTTVVTKQQMFSLNKEGMLKVLGVNAFECPPGLSGLQHAISGMVNTPYMQSKRASIIARVRQNAPPQEARLRLW